MSVSEFLQACGSVVTWIFGTVFPAITSAIVSNGIFLTVVIISLLSTVILLVLKVVMAIIGRHSKGGDSD